MASQIFKDDVGTITQITVRDEDGAVINLADASMLKIKFLKGDGKTAVTKTATLATDGSDGKMQYVSVAGDFNQEGTWVVQGYVEIGSLKFHTSKSKFAVVGHIKNDQGGAVNRSTHSELIQSWASVHSLDPLLVEAVVLKESSDNTFAWNPEPRYRYLWNVKTKKPFRTLTGTEIASEVPPPDFPTLAGDRDQEWWGQQASWGLMQLMGALARELGFEGPYLPALCVPRTNLVLGCKHLASLLRWAQGDRSRALAAYNAGKGNVAAGASYAASVLSIYKTL